MNALEINTFRSIMDNTIKDVCDNHNPIIITNKNEYKVVIISLEDYNSLEETAYLLSGSKNKKRLSESIEELESGEGKERELLQ
ncbi:YefM antitoxin of the YoeB-YefM toxin-antitoxin pair and DNA binding transcriptional repressor [Candidatus Magnetomoraceae bacterium gMMP-15]